MVRYAYHSAGHRHNTHTHTHHTHTTTHPHPHPHTPRCFSTHLAPRNVALLLLLSRPHSRLVPLYLQFRLLQEASGAPAGLGTLLLFLLLFSVCICALCAVAVVVTAATTTTIAAVAATRSRRNTAAVIDVDAAVGGALPVLYITTTTTTDTGTSVCPHAGSTVEQGLLEVEGGCVAFIGIAQAPQRALGVGEPPPHALSQLPTHTRLGGGHEVGQPHVGDHVQHREGGQDEHEALVAELRPRGHGRQHTGHGTHQDLHRVHQNSRAGDLASVQGRQMGAGEGVEKADDRQADE